jgi:hypothetical protein
VKGQPKSRLSGVADLFRTPSPASTPEFSETPHSLYSDIPETPNGPGEMMVNFCSQENLYKDSRNFSLT